MFNQNPYYNNYNYYNHNHFIPTYYPNKDYNISANESNPIEEIPVQEKIIKEDESHDISNSSSKKTRFGPFTISNTSINILGFNIEIDDLIIIGLILLLLFQTETDYILIIILGLILLNIDFSSLNHLF